MEAVIHKIYCYDDENAKIYLSLEVKYGHGGVMHSDIVKLNYNGWKKDIQITVRAKNPGIGTVVERLTEIINHVDLAHIKTNPFKELIKSLSDKLNLSYQDDIIQKVLQDHQAFVNKTIAK